MRARALLAALMLAACRQATRPPEVARIDAAVAQGAHPWTGLELRDDPDDFRFAVVTDRTGEHRKGVFESAMPKLDVLQPSFVMSVGDLIEGYTEDRAELAREWDEFQGFVGRLQMPFFYVPGNHDMSNRAMAEAWHERFGPTFYHFRYKGVLFVALNSELFGMVHDPGTPLPGPETQAQQMEWLERVLAENRDVRWTLVFLHQPLWERKPIPADWLRIEDLLEGRPHTVFAGHFHQYTSEQRRGSDYLTLATTGGGSQLRGLVFGEFDHVALVTMTRRGPVIANLLLDGIQDKDVRTRAERDALKVLTQALTIAPLEASSDPFRSGTARFRIANGGPEPLEVAGVIDGGRQLRASVERVSRSVAPGESAPLEIGLEAAARVPLAALAPGRVHWMLRTQAVGGKRVELARDSLLLPERRFAIPRLQRKLEIDGALDDWGALPFAAQTPVQVDGSEHY
ncbi:MAG TPA: metallophosphoesterase, partial [Myxococcota bacterium]|nr:metallophosphoesterase [Myxococcota bacterium]